jgi:hypothetical protein
MARVKVATAEARTPDMFPEAPKPEGTAAPPVASPDSERKAIQSEGTPLEQDRKRLETSARELEIRKAQDEALEKTKARLMAAAADVRSVAAADDADDEKAKALGLGFFGPKDDALSRVIARKDAEKSLTEASGGADEDEPVTATHGEEMYGKTGTFSSYRVGPFTSSTKVRRGESRGSAYARLLGELRDVAKVEREKAHADWAAHFTTHFVPKP